MRRTPIKALNDEKKDGMEWKSRGVGMVARASLGSCHQALTLYSFSSARALCVYIYRERLTYVVEFMSKEKTTFSTLRNTMLRAVPHLMTTPRTKTTLHI